ncbi:glycogen synthase, partial [Kipferlia bialata]|eukprot:g13478.t1
MPLISEQKCVKEQKAVYGDESMFLLGPWIGSDPKYSTEFQAEPCSKLAPSIEAFCLKTGVSVHVGRWLVDGSPRVILFDLVYPPQFQQYISA